ncbi:MAG: AAA family ATPase [Actinobacteria bacterium 69-20]|nr:MAG: AAA family ATPase [Actinobacteria bacterium 69-20]
MDEWQLAPSLWNVIRHEIDDRRACGQFILAGSATPTDDVTRHSGAGRLARLRMRPMALAESRQLSDGISLAGLAPGAMVSGACALTYQALAESAVIGGWPALLTAATRAAIAFNRAYVDDLCGTEVPAATGVRHDPTRVRRLLESIARNVSSEATLQSLATDVSGDGSSTDPKTVAIYMDALRRVFAVEELPAWSVALRSRSRLRTSPKLHLADPALACAALGIGAERLARDPEFFGQVFESMVVRDLRVLAGAEFGRVYHYRDNTGLEIDAIVEYPDGKWGAVEVKLGSAKLADAERHLLTLRDERVDVHRTGQPAYLAVVTGTEYAYTLPSGVHVIPLGLLQA